MARCRDQAANDAERRRRHALEQRTPRVAVTGARGGELVGGHFDFRESLHFYRPRCASGRKGRKNFHGSRRLALYFAPRAGMAELVDAADSKSVALKRRVGSIPSPGTINT